ncbi:MAG: hypothetical protein P8Y99_12135 [Calditrichaceae bacterium]
MNIPKKYWQIAKRLTSVQLQKQEDNGDIISEKDLFNINIGKRGHNLFLGYYSLEGIKLAFEKYDVLKKLQEKGFTNLVYEMNTSDPYVHKLIVFHKKKSPQNMLMELVLKKYNVIIDMPFDTKYNGNSYETIAIEWMCLQNPYTEFTEGRPQLPGQQHPGLGIASKAVELLMIMSWRLNLCGLVNTPDHYHNASLYSRIFYYLNPEYQARMLAIMRDLNKYSLDKIAWAIEWGTVVELNSDKPVKWQVGKQIVPLHQDLKDLFNSKEYKNTVNQKMKKYKFKLNIEKYNKIKEKGVLHEA